MYSDDSNSKKSSDKTLKEFLYSLYPDEDDEKTQAYSFPFQFFQDILVKSVLSSGFEFLFRTIFYIALDFFIVFSSPFVPWFQNFYPDKEILSYSYISTKIAVQVVSSLAVILVFNIIVIQWAYYVLYDPVQHLSEKSATFLHITFCYLPPLVSLLLGFLFGCLIILNSDANMSTSYCTILSVMISIVFILYMINYLLYCTFTNYSMLIRRGLFSSWEAPYSIVSNVIFFILTTAFPFVSSSFRKLCSFFSIIMLIWSLIVIYNRQKPVYLSSIAYFIEIKVIFDGVFFSVFTLINFWLNIELQYTMIVMQTLYFTSFFVSGIMSSSSYSYIRSSLHEDGSINQRNFPNSNACIMAIRISLNFSMKTFIQPDFLKWMVKNRFSSEIVPDIVRLNFVLKTSLNDFQIPATTFNPLELISLKFLAFQVRQYEKFILSSPDHPSINYAIEETRRLMQIVDNVSKDFWTNRDYEQLSIADFGKKIFRISCFIQNSAISFPHSTDVQNLWIEYCKSIVRTPSKTIIKHVHEFTYIENPGNTVYLFLNGALPEDFDIRNQKRIDSTTENFISSYVDAAFTPIRMFYRFVPFSIFLVGIIFASFFALRANKAYDMFSDNVKILTLSLSMCLDSLNSADALVQMPSVNFISKTLHISIDAASMFRNDISINNPIYDDIISYMTLFNPFDIDINYSFCPKFTLGLLIIFDFPETNENFHTCHLLWTAAYTNRINEIAEYKYTNFVPFFSSAKNKDSKFGADVLQGLIVCVFGLIFIITFIVITMNQRKKIKKLILSIENIVAMNNEICERGEPYIGFHGFIYFLIIFLLIALLSLYYVAYIFSIRKLENDMIELANQTLLVTNVCRCVTLTMASSIIEVGLKQQLSNEGSNSYIYDNPFGNKTSNTTLNSQSFIRTDNKNLTLIERFTIAIKNCRRLFVNSLINAANILTLNDLNEIFKDAINWVPDSSEFEITTSLRNSTRTNATRNVRNKKTTTSNSNQTSTNNMKKIYSYSNQTSTKKIHPYPFRPTMNDIELNDNYNEHINLFDMNSEVAFSSEIDFEAASMTSLSSIVIDFAQLLNDDNLTAESFNFLMAKFMFKINISELLTTAFPEIASLTPIIFKYMNESYWINFVLITLCLVIVSHFAFFQMRCQKKWFFGISVLIRRAMATYPQRFLYIISAILEDMPKYFDGLPIPIIVHNKKGTILYANQIVMQYTKHTMDQTIGQPYNEFFTDNSTKYTGLTFSTEKQSFVNLNENIKKKLKKKSKSNENNEKSDEENDDNLDDLDTVNNDENENNDVVVNRYNEIAKVDPSDCFDLIILRDTSKFLELQKTFNDLKKRVTPEVGSVPSRGRLIFIECRFKTESVKPNVIFKKIEEISLKYKEKKSDKKIESINKHFKKKHVHITTSPSNDNDNDNDSHSNEDKPIFDDLFDFKDEKGDMNDRCVTVISCGASYLTAIARVGCEEEAIRFVLDMSGDIFMSFRASITEGVGTVFGLLEGGSLVVVAGDVSRRATDANLYGLWGRIYIDYSVIERSGIEKELQNDEIEKVEKNASSEDNRKPSNALTSPQKFLGKNLIQSTLSPGPAKTPPQLLPKLPSPMIAANPFKTPPDNPAPSVAPQPQQQQQQPGKFGLPKFGLGFGFGKAASAPAQPSLKKPLIVSISPLSEI